MVIDVYSLMVLGFSIYLEKPSAFTVGMAIAHAILPKENWLAGVGVQAEWPCWGKMRTIHCENAKEYRGTVKRLTKLPKIIAGGCERRPNRSRFIAASYTSCTTNLNARASFGGLPGMDEIHHSNRIPWARGSSEP